MLSHLRFHRRAPSNPTSPIPDQGSSPWEANQTPELPQHTHQDAPPQQVARPRSSHATGAPPTLPPIPRVTSENDMLFDKSEQQTTSLSQSKSPPQPRASNGGGGERESGFMGGVALQNYRLSLQQAQQHAATAPSTTAAPNLPESALTRSKPPPPPINTGRPSQPKASSFVAPTELYGTQSASSKRPAGTRLATEPATLAHLNGVGLSPVVEPQKPKKGLPFLKNPMSTLLARRKTAQNAADMAPVPKATRTSEPVYDPRIRGTRVHDFSAPRPRRIVSTMPDQMGAPTAPPPPPPPPPPAPTTEPPAPPQRSLSGAVPAAQDIGQAVTQSPDEDVPPEVPARASSRPTSKHHSEAALQATASEEANREKMRDDPEVQDQVRRFSLEERTVPAGSVPPVPPKSKSRAALETSAISQPKPGPSIRTMSRNASASARSVRDGTLTALPKHMKSTSSRFSFDMVGAAKQEKLLEERHRQRELERQDDEPDEPGCRDSRFDDIDDFDYDAMMDDGGFEERIPGVNTDAEDYDYMYGEEEIPMTGEDDYLSGPGDNGFDSEEARLDPDNDQENFSGFVFQRSNPVSAMTSPTTPGMLVTPRDDSGKVIGFAMTKDSGTPGLHGQQLPSPSLHDAPIASPRSETAISGLGIVNFPPASGGEEDGFLRNEVHEQPQASNSAIQAPKARGDELYYDGGFVGDFADELDFEHDNPSGEPFDESIFDLDDTDRYGRPLPGVFAQVQAQRAAEREASAAKRESDQTSHLSGQSILSQSPRASSNSTSLAAAPAHEEASGPSAKTDAESSGNVEAPSGDSGPKLVSPIPSSRDALYQAALAEAANKAAASGKFRRDSSPPPLPTDLLVTSPTTGSEAPLSGRSGIDAFADDDTYEDDPYSQPMDDYDDMDGYDFDDDDIVAEANASALANDQDGFYGQEFGFYSNAPSQYGQHGHNYASGSNSHAALSKENLYEYANGGFFGPSGGLERSKSGRVVCREPNLTPITERSEYSNRNSIMSLGLPSASLNSAHPDRSLQSPGLAQLAMMDDGDMSLSSLLRLRSRAFGGSQASLVSSRGDGGSPRSERPADGLMSPWSPPGQGPPLSAGLPYLGVNHGRKSSVLSAHSRDSDTGSMAGSPTMTMNMSFPAAQSPSSLAPPSRSLSSPARSPARPVSLSFSTPSSHIAQMLHSPSTLPAGRMSTGGAGSEDLRPALRMRSPSLDDNRISSRSNSNLGFAHPAAPSSSSPLSLSSVFSTNHHDKGVDAAGHGQVGADGNQGESQRDHGMAKAEKRNTFGEVIMDEEAFKRMMA
ncbi:hypothetical protein PpBr36_00611 [Pyricularia pennisetigena]|uniref:hypothetical protein n=1 Tax=Pyricularia pennisetigena TaxID=1578925 RepID=UPI00114DA0E4|nr:hypothetical protein PpBr36_00611 [Pyricularia pennisetigena]TLS28627.1 hypothetical protein PpBr36_00611 [Pyricularia pennisetigena]